VKMGKERGVLGEDEKIKGPMQKQKNKHNY
jgi:hypothetical protein